MQSPLCPARKNLTKNEQNKVQWKFVTRYIYCIVASANFQSCAYMQLTGLTDIVIPNYYGQYTAKTP